MTDDTVTAKPKFPLAPLLMLAVATFMSITIEMLPTGLMHLMAPDLGVSEAQIGLLMTVFAYTVVLTSTPLMAILRRVPKRVLLVGVLVIFAFTAFATALSPNYSLVLISRIFNGVAHGVFWASVTAYTGSLVRPEQLTKAVSITGGGGGLAFVLGVPLGTALGQAFGWQLTFVVLALVCLLVAVALWFVLPKGVGDEPSPVTSPIEVTGPIQTVSITPKQPKSMGLVAVLCILVALVMTGHYSFYSYISPFLLGPGQLPELWLPAVLFGYGIAAAVATPLTGLLFTGRGKLGFFVAFGLMTVGGGLLALFPQQQLLAIISIVMWGLGMGFMPTLLQSRLLAIAPTKHRDLASALYTSGFNLGIGSGALVGGALLGQFGMTSLGVSFLSLMLLGLVVFLASQLGAARRNARANRLD